MSQRLQNTTKWLWCLLALYAGPMWNPVRSVTVRTPPNIPATIEAQAKYFQDFFSVQLSPYKIEFGHVCEDPNTWEQRYEKKDFKNHRDMGKVRWGDKQGGYGEHYWDLNHAGNAHNHGNDDSTDNYDNENYGNDNQNYGNDNQNYGNDNQNYGNDNQNYGNDNGYDVHDTDPYDEPSDQSPNYNSEYNPEKSSKYEENSRAKRAHTKIKADTSKIEEEKSIQVQEKTERKRPKVKRHRPVLKELNYEEDPQQKYLIKSQGDSNQEGQAGQYAKQESHNVPYENGAGVRQHQQPEVVPAASSPRLFLEPSTGHVVDRATGQAYVLQPILAGY